jgi:ribosomal protein L16 Arg81 hydroxylase
MLVKYDNGKEEVLQAGDIFYLPPGHTGIVQENLKLIDFSPTKEFNEVMEHIGKKMAEFEA